MNGKILKRIIFIQIIIIQLTILVYFVELNLNKLLETIAVPQTLLNLIKSFIFSSFTEEFAKFIPLYMILYKKYQKEDLKVILTIALISGFTFATIENSLYIIDFGHSVLLLRLLSATLLHSITAGIIGIYLMDAKNQTTLAKTQQNIIIGLLLVVSLHGLYNFFLLSTESLISNFLTILVTLSAYSLPFIGTIFLIFKYNGINRDKGREKY